MIKFTVLLGWIILPNILPSRDGDLRILHGPRASFHLYPYMAFLQVREDDWTIGECGGSIVSDTVVATACHCVSGVADDRIILRSTKDARVIAGTGDPRNENAANRQVSRVRRFHCHPRANPLMPIYVPGDFPPLISYDAAIVKLRDALRFVGNVQRIKLFSYNEATLTAEFNRLINKRAVCFVAGWGKTKLTPDSENYFSVADVRLMSLATCRKSYCPLYNFFCELHTANAQTCTLPTTKVSPCYGDSGGPLICSGMLYGVYSGANDCSKRMPRIFASPAAMLYVLKEYGNIREANRPFESEASALLTRKTRITNAIMLAVFTVLKCWQCE